tara:strand:- start:75 stop:902 length:828 start_codon:yes stop_codon:yes gene_type:complete
MDTLIESTSGTCETITSGTCETITSGGTSGDTTTQLEKPKKGRRPKTKPYFGQVQEAAVRVFLTATTFDERNKVFNADLRDPLNKMIESIIRRYKLYRKDFVYEDIHADTLSFLITKAEKFKPEKGKKAYSYFGTICKNYLMGMIMKDQKERNRKISYEDIAPSFENGYREGYSYEMKDDELGIEILISRLLDKIKTFMSENKLTENEEKVGLSLIEVFENYEEIFIAGSGNKFNKNVILYQLREMTGLTTKEIRNSLTRYKDIYKLVSQAFKNQ